MAKSARSSSGAARRKKANATPDVEKDDDDEEEEVDRWKGDTVGSAMNGGGGSGGSGDGDGDGDGGSEDAWWRKETREDSDLFGVLVMNLRS